MAQWKERRRGRKRLTMILINKDVRRGGCKKTKEQLETTVVWGLAYDNDRKNYSVNFFQRRSWQGKHLVNC